MSFLDSLFAFSLLLSVLFDKSFINFFNLNFLLSRFCITSCKVLSFNECEFFHISKYFFNILLLLILSLFIIIFFNVSFLLLLLFFSLIKLIKLAYIFFINTFLIISMLLYKSFLLIFFLSILILKELIESNCVLSLLNNNCLLLGSENIVN